LVRFQEEDRVQENHDEVLVAKTETEPKAVSSKKSRRALWIVLAVLGACMLLGLGAIAGGGAVYGLTRARSRLYVRPSVRWALPRDMPHMDLPGMPQRGMMGLEAGAMIVDVVPDGPADQAGLSEGDLLVAIEDKEIGEKSDLAAMIAEYKPGDKVRLKVAEFGPRLGQESREVTVTLAEHPEDEGKAYLGVTFVSISDDGFHMDGGSFRFRGYDGEGLFDGCDEDCGRHFEFRWPRR
jgi:membrane-associated protease RseP (regulator of RpoE activity)